MNIRIIKKKVKRITIKVQDEKTIEIVAPKYVSDSYIRTLLIEKREWIERKLKEIGERKQNISQLNEGDMIFYLGKKYRLHLIKSSKNIALFKDGIMTLYMIDTDNFQLKQEILNIWYRNKGKEIFLPILQKYLNLTGKTIERVSIKTIKTRWGSCNPALHTINLNSEMLKKDIKFIEYVILHEIAHLTHPNHSQDFYSYVAKFMPDWQERKSLAK